MTNRFLENGAEGKNNWWVYLITIISSWILSNIIAVLLFVFIMVFYFLSSGNFDINAMLNSLTNVESDPILFFLLIFLSFTISTIILLFCVKYLHKKSLMSLINTSKIKDVSGKTISWYKRIRWDRFLKGIVLWSVFLVIMLFIQYIINPNSFIFNFNINNVLFMILLFIIAIPIQVTFEELFFRGYLLQGLSLKIKSPIIIILISSIIFSIGHVLNGGDNPIFMIQNVSITFIIGIILCGFTLVDKGIELAIGVHLANNFFAFIINSSEGSIGSFNSIIQTVETDPIITFLFEIVSLLIFAFVLFLYKKEDVLTALNINK